MQTIISLLFILFCASIASAASFVITTNGDTHDASTADGVCADSGGNCTLRAAVEQSGATTSDDAITFAGGLSTIILTLNSEIAVNKSGALQITANSLVSIERSQATGTPEHRIFNIALTARVTMTNLKISFGQTPVGDFTGGGIKNSGSLILTASTVSGNLAGITTFSSDLRISYGGGIYNNGSLTLENCVVENNRASHVSGFGGGIYNDSGGSISITDSTIRGNNASGQYGLPVPGSGEGAGIFNAGTAVIGNSNISGNTAQGRFAYGGGFRTSGRLDVVAATITDNRASGLSNSICQGAGIYSSSSSLNIVRSTLSYNTVNGGGQSDGGAIYSTNNLYVTNSTVANNSAENSGSSSSGRGAGIFANGGNLISVTVTGNRAAVGSASSNATGGIFASGTALSLVNTLVGNNFGSPSAPEVYGIFSSSGNNLISNSTGSSGWTNTDLLNVNPRLSAFGDYGGQTPTVPLLSDSPAINAGNNSNAYITDQRGAARIVGGRIDIGAFESETYPGYIGNFSGRLTTESGRAVPLAPVTLTSVYGEDRYGFTNAFGYYRFKNIPAGISYTLRAHSKKYSVAPQVVSISDN